MSNIDHIPRRRFRVSCRDALTQRSSRSPLRTQSRTRHIGQDDARRLPASACGSHTFCSWYSDYQLILLPYLPTPVDLDDDATTVRCVNPGPNSSLTACPEAESDARRRWLATVPRVAGPPTSQTSRLCAWPDGKAVAASRFHSSTG